MIKYSIEFQRKSFSAKSFKEAYLKAAKWYATYFLSKEEFGNIHVEYIKEDRNPETKEYMPTITIHLYSVLDNQKDVMKKHCACCREMHSSFFINEDTHCDRCSALAMETRMKEMLNRKRGYYRELSKRFGGLD